MSDDGVGGDGDGVVVVDDGDHPSEEVVVVNHFLLLLLRLSGAVYERLVVDELEEKRSRRVDTRNIPGVNPMARNLLLFLRCLLLRPIEGGIGDVVGRPEVECPALLLCN